MCNPGFLSPLTIPESNALDWGKACSPDCSVQIQFAVMNVSCCGAAQPRAWRKSEAVVFFSFFFLPFCLFAFSWADPSAYGSSQARGQIGAIGAGLSQSHSNAGSEPRLQPTPQLMATPDP